MITPKNQLVSIAEIAEKSRSVAAKIRDMYCYGTHLCPSWFVHANSCLDDRNEYVVNVMVMSFVDFPDEEHEKLKGPIDGIKIVFSSYDTYNEPACALPIKKETQSYTQNTESQGSLIDIPIELTEEDLIFTDGAI